MELGKIQDPLILEDPPLPTLWGDIRNFFIGLPDRWDMDKRSAYVDRSAERPGSTTEDEELPTLWGFVRSFFGKSSVDDDANNDNFENDNNALGWPFSSNLIGYNNMDMGIDDEF